METIQETEHMKDGSQTQQETDTQIVNILHPKEVCRVGSWNVRTLYQTGKLAQVLKEMDRYNIQILGTCETRWTGNGTRKLATGHQILYSGRKDEQHSSGVGLILSRKLGKCMLGWKPYSDRLLSARFHSKFAKLTVVVCYSPTEDKDEEEKDSFYEELQRAIEETPVHDVLLILGDLNAKVGTNNEGKESIMGKYGCGVINNNGSRLVDFCQENKLVIGGTIFQHKNIHKLTWTSPDGHTRNQIDHVLINKRWRGTLQDVRALRGADVGSDHTLVLVKLKLKLRKIKKGEQRSPQVDVSKLKDPTLMKSFQLEVKNRFTILRNKKNSVLNNSTPHLLMRERKHWG
ncbi:craniofacial development protein 2-like [Saccostrea echinata]|uniref:craniofacial development protein 2-like n=1 Tax=Saccostrea echinata TaxID=191078 RepID=UPI002A816A98|nr:craniofacial development protein 2-like [Saccostrea echinata]